MKQFIIKITQLPHWYSISIILVYSLLVAEFLSTINHLMPVDDSLKNILAVFAKISYGTSVLSGIVIWIVLTFLFHLTALLFNGQTTFGRFLLASAYPYIIPAVMILAGIFMLDGIQVPNTEDALNILMNNQSFKLAMNLINYSFIPYYLLIAVLIHYTHQIKYMYAFLSVAIPVVSIWGITELFKLI